MLYVLQLHQDNSTNSAHVSSVSEFTLAQPCLCFAILDAGTKRFKKTKGDDSHLDEITTGKTFTEISLLPHHKNCVNWDRVHTCQGNVREISVFQGQGIVREFYVVSVKNECLLKCQGNVREFYHFQLVSNNEKQKMASAVFLTFWIQAKSFW